MKKALQSANDQPEQTILQADQTNLVYYDEYKIDKIISNLCEKYHCDQDFAIQIMGAVINSAPDDVTFREIEDTADSLTQVVLVQKGAIKT